MAGWCGFDAIGSSRKELEENQTLLVQSGCPVGLFKTHKDAPRVLIGNSNLVPNWATWDHFNELENMVSYLWSNDRGILDLHWHSRHCSRDL